MQEFEFNELQVTRTICCVFGVAPHCPIHRLQSGSGLWGKCYSSGFFLRTTVMYFYIIQISSLFIQDLSYLIVTV